MAENISLENLTSKQKEELLRQLQREVKSEREQKREAYESLRSQFISEVFENVIGLTDSVTNFKRWLDKEGAAFKKVMSEYGQTKFEDQGSFTITEGDMKLEIRSNKIKTFDERADLAAERLIDYLRKYMLKSERGAEDPIYQLAMTLLERNKQGQLDYKSISKLYTLEDKFDEEYSDIMILFKESNVVQKTALNYYFSRRDKDGVWRKIEPSFCRI